MTAQTVVEIAKDGREAVVFCDGREVYRHEGCILTGYVGLKLSTRTAYGRMVEIVAASVADGWIVVRATHWFANGRTMDVTAPVLGQLRSLGRLDTLLRVLGLLGGKK